MSRLLFAALISVGVVAPAAAQSGRSFVADQQRVAIKYGPIQNQIYAPGLPGVALDANVATDRPSGPGGLSNGVGGVGTLVPSTSSSNGQLLNDEGNSIGIPFPDPGRRFAD